MNRIDRLIAILTVLQSKRFVTAEFIAEKYEISIRTVYRDLKSLGEIGIPIFFESQKGYSISQGFFLPPVSFTSEEANGIILISALSEKFTDYTTNKHVENAINKIKSVLRSPHKEKLNQLQSQIKVYNPSTKPRNKDFLNEIQNAIVDKCILKIKYTNNKNEKSDREIEPIGLTFYSNQWHLIAWCSKKHSYRDFKINQINELIITKESFTKQNHYDINEYIKSIM
jgi:predicted DNA-binding transcriptional regulator YafY